MSKSTKNVDVMDKLLDMVCDEIEKISEETALTTTSLANLDKLVDIKKDILELKKMEGSENNMNGYSNNYSNGYSNNNRMMNSYSSYPMNGASGYHRQPYYVQADMWGGFPMQYGYSRTGSEEEMINMLKEMAENSTPDKKEMIHNFVRQLETM